VAELPPWSLDSAGLSVRELPAPRAIASVIARRGMTQAAAAFIADGLRTPLPEVMVLPTGPGHWLAIRDAENRDIPVSQALANAAGNGGEGPLLEAQLAAALGAWASVCDQTGGRVRFAVGGERAREFLGRGVGIDLHPQHFAVGQVAVTAIAHIGAVLWQVDTRPTYHLLVAGSYAGSFRHWLQSTVAALG